MSNVRPSCMNATSAPSCTAGTSLRCRFHAGGCVLSPPLGRKLRFARAVRPSAVGAPPAVCCRRATLFRSRSVPLVMQGIRNRAFVQTPGCRQEKVPPAVLHKVSRSCTRRCSSSSAVRPLVSKKGAAHRSWWRQPRPNPSVEGMAKRLRLLSTPHLER
jgi:hypothetical protein